MKDCPIIYMVDNMDREDHRCLKESRATYKDLGLTV